MLTTLSCNILHFELFIMHHCTFWTFYHASLYILNSLSCIIVHFELFIMQYCAFWTLYHAILCILTTCYHAILNILTTCYHAILYMLTTLSCNIVHFDLFIMQYCAFWQLYHALLNIFTTCYHAILYMLTTLSCNILHIDHFIMQCCTWQVVIQSGQPPTILQQMCSLPFQYFSDPRLTNVLFPTLIACCYNNSSNKEILEQELSCMLLANFIEVSLLLAHMSQILITLVMHDPFNKGIASCTH